MITDDRSLARPRSWLPGTRTGPRSRTWLYRLAAPVLVALTLSVVAGTFMTRWLGAGESASPPAPRRTEPEAAPAPAVKLFRDWPADKPLLALVLSGEGHGYLQPCGCSKPQLGGLPRRWNFIQELKKKGWPVVPLDLGDIPNVPTQRGPQATLKYGYSMRSLQAMDYKAVGLGQHDISMPLMNILAEYALQQEDAPPRILAANLLNKEQEFPGANRPSLIGSWELAGGEGDTPRVGIIGTVGPSVAAQVKDPAVRFANNAQVLPEVLKQVQAKKPEFLVLLYQGTLAEARACAQKFPQFHVILCLSKEEEPSDKPEREGQTMIVSVGHKGRYVGVVGIWPLDQGQRKYTMRYQLVPLGEEYETPEGQEKDNPIMVLMEEYAQVVKKDNYLARYQQRKHPLQAVYPDAVYVGSHECKICHAEAYKVWENSGHAHAYLTLQNAKRPGLREFDGECVVCHTVGFGYNTGFKDENTTPLLQDVGCESCHGPSSLHVEERRTEKNPAKWDMRLAALMNPYRPLPPGATPAAEAQRINLLDQSCQKCHDIDNDVHWNFAKKWPKIVHHESRKNKGAPKAPSP